jgi:hypothetical protein
MQKQVDKFFLMLFLCYLVPRRMPFKALSISPVSFLHTNVKLDIFTCVVKKSIKFNVKSYEIYIYVYSRTLEASNVSSETVTV